MVEKGTFVPEGRHDILTEVIGTSEHGGRVHGVGRGATISNYFGRSSCPTRTKNVSEIEAKIEEKLAAKIKAECKVEFEQQMATAHQLMQKPFMETLKNMGLSDTSQTNKQIEPCSEKVVVLGSAKGSCSAAQENHKVDWTTDNVQKVICMILKEKQYLRLKLENGPEVINFLIAPKCVKDLLVGGVWLDYSILQVWCTCMHRLCIEKNKSNVFGFLDPTKLSFKSKSAMNTKPVKSYIGCVI